MVLILGKFYICNPRPRLMGTLGALAGMPTTAVPLGLSPGRQSHQAAAAAAIEPTADGRAGRRQSQPEAPFLVREFPVDPPLCASTLACPP